MVSQKSYYQNNLKSYECVIFSKYAILLKKMLQDYSYDSHRNLKFISSELRRTPST